MQTGIWLPSMGPHVQEGLWAAGTGPETSNKDGAINQRTIIRRPTKSSEPTQSSITDVHVETWYNSINTWKGSIQYRLQCNYIKLEPDRAPLPNFGHPQKSDTLQHMTCSMGWIAIILFLKVRIWLRILFWTFCRKCPVNFFKIDKIMTSNRIYGQYLHVENELLWCIDKNFIILSLDTSFWSSYILFVSE